jgi:hypothetical protein
MKKPKINFRVFGDSGPLSASFHSGTLGDAVEAVSGDGVGFFSPVSRELLAVEFDDVSSKSDHQILKFKGGVEVEVLVENGQATVKVHQPKKQKTA